MKDIQDQQIFPNQPYQRQNTMELLQAVRKNDLSSAEDLVILDKFLVFNFDNFKLTALHWAAKRGY